MKPAIPLTTLSINLFTVSCMLGSCAALAQEATPRKENARTVEVTKEIVILADGDVVALAAPVAPSAPPAPPAPPTPPGAVAPPAPPAPPAFPFGHVQHFNYSGGDGIDMVVSTAIGEAFGAVGAGSSGKTVKNAPYSAEVVSERIQNLPDGNQIVKRSSSMVYRDSAGRTRQESRDTNGETRSVQIRDAVDGTRLVLNPRSKTATRIAIDRDLDKRMEEVRERAKAAMERAKAAGQTTVTERGGGPGEEIIVHRAESPASNGKEIREEVKVSVVRGTDGAGGNKRIVINGQELGDIKIDGDAITRVVGDGLRPLSNMMTDGKWMKSTTTKDLGSKDFDGVRAEGKLRSYTIPAGEVGNKNPIVISTETWVSPDLQVTVYSKHSDPRSGETVYRLANLRRGEQPIGLFGVPDGFTLKESKAGASWSVKSK